MKYCRRLVVEAYDDRLDALLFPAEEAVITRAVDKRRREFTTTRLCARDALSHLGYGPIPILPGLRGAPRWPAGVVGSMTHCTGYRAAAVAHKTDMVTIGIDAEAHDRLPEGVLDIIALPEEHAWMRRMVASDPSIHWDRLLFSAKESVFKAWFPLTLKWLDFLEASITVHPAGTWAARLLVSGPVVDGRQITQFEGRWLVGRGLLLTAIATGL
jgi:4'-phosphopantetheinyl transferase EntD